MQQQTLQVMIVPLQPVPAQFLRVTLGGQICQIRLYQKSTGLFLDLYLNNAPVFVGQIARDRVSFTAQPYLGFVGDLYFKDTMGVSDPEYTGLGTRYVLGYMAPTI